MSCLSNESYRLRSHAGVGGYLNVYGNEEVSNNRDVCIWSLDNNANAQKWKFIGRHSETKILSAINNDYALNYYWKNGRGMPGNCDIYPHVGNDEDSFVELIPISSLTDVYKIKLSHFDLCLSAGGSLDAAKVTWEKPNNTIVQLWKLEVVSEQTFAYPTNSKKLSQGYHVGHRGIDIPAALGTPVFAFCDGIVAAVQSSSITWHPKNDTDMLNGNCMQSMGNMITINHKNPDAQLVKGDYARSIYMHLQHAPKIKPLDSVCAGDIIGYIGNTGRSTGSHLHFSLAVGYNEFMEPGQTGWKPLGSLPLIDPCNYLKNYS